MNAFSFPGQMSASLNYDYIITEYDGVGVREVIRGDAATGEFHVKLRAGTDVERALDHFRAQFGGQEVGLVDPTGVLNLDYPIYIIIKDQMMLEVAHSVFENSSNALNAKQ